MVPSFCKPCMQCCMVLVKGGGKVGAAAGGFVRYKGSDTTNHSSSKTWQAPLQKWQRINCDSSIKHREGIGYIAGEAITDNTITDIHEAKAGAVLQGPNEAFKMRLKRIVVETDSKSIVNKVNGNGSPVLHKINCDGSPQIYAGIGYIIRDHGGEMIAAEAISNKFITDNTKAEAEAIRKGLEAALQIGLRNVMLETDSESVAKMLNGVASPGGRMKNIICEVVRVKSKFNQCEIRHVKRRANRCADYLAELGATGKPWRFGQDPVPEGLLLRLNDDNKLGPRFQ